MDEKLGAHGKSAKYGVDPEDAAVGWEKGIQWRCR